MLENQTGNNTPKCHFCALCDGTGCIGEMPGMGGVFDNANFIANCKAWHDYQAADIGLPHLRLAPITGAVQNVGWHDEKSFYRVLLSSCFKAGLALSIGDGTPDEKLLYGIEAIEGLHTKAAVFIKPYPDELFFKRLEWAHEAAEIFGIDIDSYNIVTMRNLVHLEKKTPSQLLKIKNSLKVPFAIKGIFTDADIQTVREVRPDIAVISNHGGRIETARGSTARFLELHARDLKKYCGEIWVDGGLRTAADLRVARFLGASACMIARPVLTALLRDGETGVAKMLKSLTGGQAQHTHA